MTTLSRYVVRETVKAMLAVFLCITTVYWVADFVNKADDFMEVNLPVFKMFLCFVAQTPLEQFIPASTLISVLVVFGLMGRHNETLALKSAGISPWHLIKAALTVGVGVSVLLLFCTEVLFPALRGQANRIWREEVQEGKISRDRKDIWIKEKGRIFHFSHYDPQKKTLFGITLNEFDNNFQLVRRLDAVQGRFVDGKWVLTDGMEHLMAPEGGAPAVTLFAETTADLGIDPQDLRSVAKESEEMGLVELAAYIAKVESEGYDTTAYRVDFQEKLAFPFMGIMLCLLASGIALYRERAPNLPMMILSGIGIAFLYWVIRSFAISLAYGGMLHPVAAAWVSNVIFLGVGVYLLVFGN